jgi:hypothetical protein
MHFANIFNFYHDRLFLEQLLSPEDLEDQEIIWLGEKVNKEKIKEYFAGLIPK